MKKLLLSVLLMASSAFADTPITLVVPHPAGGAADNVARVVQQTIAKTTNRTVVIEYKLGAGGDVATNYVANAPKDKLILLMHTVNMSISAAIKPPTYNESDIVPLVNLGTMPLIMVTGPNSKFSNINGFKKINQNTPINFGSSGLFSVSHFAGEILKNETGKDMTHIPYQGQAKTIVDVISGTLDMAFLYPDIAVPQVNGGKLVPIATTAHTRLSALPNVPTFKESGINGLDISAYFILLSNRTDNPSEYKAIRESVIKALKSQNEIELYKAVHLDPVKDNGLSENFIISETAKFKELIKKLNLEIK